jgi:two-component system OmpR family response regulator
MHCLVIDQDSATTRVIVDGLRAAGYQPCAAATKEDGLAQLLARQWDLVVIDTALPAAPEGLALIRTLRALGHHTPIVAVSDLGDAGDVVRGLESGADDYLVKPFMMTELVARIEALWRRSRAGEQALQLRVGDLMLDVGTMRVTRGSTAIALQLREFRLLEFLMRNEGQMINRETLLKNVWHYQFDPHTNIVEVHISRLRGKMDKPFTHTLIHTIRGVGYMLAAQQPEAMSTRIGGMHALQRHSA